MKRNTKNAAVKLQERKESLLRQIKLPSDALPGSLSVSQLRCGKANCHCKDGKRHENWTLTYMLEGKKQVTHIPTELVGYVKKKVEEGKSFRDDINQIFLTNAELLVLLRKQKQRT